MSVPNPFEAPAAVLVDRVPHAARERRLAGRTSRFFANLIDVSIVYAFAGLLLAAWMSELQGDRTLLLGSLSAITVAVLVLQGLLYRPNGQAIGKRIFGIQTVRRDGRPAGLWRVFALRNALPFVLAFVPGLGIAFGVANVLLIFRSDRRMLHDLLADTVVVRVG